MLARQLILSNTFCGKDNFVYIYSFETINKHFLTLHFFLACWIDASYTYLSVVITKVHFKSVTPFSEKNCYFFQITSMEEKCLLICISVSTSRRVRSGSMWVKSC